MCSFDIVCGLRARVAIENDREDCIERTGKLDLGAMKLPRLVRWLGAQVQFTLRAVVALLMIGSLALANFGYPVWEVAAKKGDTPFPCQFSRCGCQTREQCRTSCCCHSKGERVAWAVERGIDPDQVAVLTTEEKFQFAFTAKKTIVSKKSSCCQTAKVDCCSKPKMESCCEPEDAKELRWVLSIAASKCKGTGVDWIQAGFVGQPPLKVVFQIETREGRVVSDSEPIYFSPVTEPLLRPV